MYNNKNINAYWKNVVQFIILPYGLPTEQSEK